MKKFQNIATIGFLFVLLFTTSCYDDILDKEPLDIISDAAVWEDESLADAYLANVYLNTLPLTLEAGKADRFNTPYDGFIGAFGISQISDEARYGWWMPAQNGHAFKFGGINKEVGPFNWWEDAYKNIRTLNIFIAQMDESPLPLDFTTRRKAEARWLRAMSYFYMVKRYGGVPLITVAQNINDPREELFPARNKEQEIYDFVISEAEDIEVDLSDSFTGADYGRPSKWAALALRSRAALYAASISDFGIVQLDGLVGISGSANSYYQKSYEASKTIMGSPHSLYNINSDKVQNFKDLFITKDGNPEVIFARTHNELDIYTGGNAWGYDFVQSPWGTNAWGGGNVDAPYLEMVEEFEYADGTPGTLDRVAIQSGLWSMDELWGGRDPRFYATIYTNETFYNGLTLQYQQGIIDDNGNLIQFGSYKGKLAVGPNVPTPASTNFGVMKYLDPSINILGTSASVSSSDFQVFRYGEILLNFAEAAFELGNTGEALNAVNQIRDRAGVALLNSIDRDKIRHERKVELAFEGHRYWDVRRWRTAETEFIGTRSGLQYIYDHNSTKYQLRIINNIDTNAMIFLPQHYYLPITIGRIAQNNNLKENPSY